MRYKAGDKVVIRKDLELDKNYGGKSVIKYTEKKQKFFRETNRIAIIGSIDYHDNSYRIVSEICMWITENMIDHEATARLNNKSEIAISTSEIQTYDSLLELKSSIRQLKQTLGGETMNANEILEKWKNKRICEIETEYRNKKDQLTKEDEIAKLIEKHIAQMNKTIKEKYDGVEKAVQVAVIRTPETDEKINLAEEEMSNKKLNIKKKIEEIKAVLEVAENQDKVFEILNKQGIIDKNYNIL